MKKYVSQSLRELPGEAGKSSLVLWEPVKPATKHCRREKKMELEQRLAEIEALTLPEKGKEIKSVISESYRLARRSVLEAYYAGCLLRSVKSDLEHGNFGVWLENNGIKHDTAARFMRLAEREISDIQKFDTIAAALKSLPKPQKAENPDPPEVSTVETLTPAEKRLMERDALIQQAKEAEARASEAQAELEEIKQQNKHLLQGEKVAQGFDQGVDVIEEAQTEVRQLKRENSKLKNELRELKKDFANYKRWATREFKKKDKEEIR